MLTRRTGRPPRIAEPLTNLATPAYSKQIVIVEPCTTVFNPPTRHADNVLNDNAVSSCLSPLQTFTGMGASGGLQSYVYLLPPLDACIHVLYWQELFGNLRHQTKAGQRTCRNSNHVRPRASFTGAWIDAWMKLMLGAIARATCICKE